MTWSPYDTCPCDCGVIGWKLTKLLPGEDIAHVVGCRCRRHTGKRARASGHRKQSKVLKDAARAEGTSMDIAPTHEEQARLLVHYESKSGESIPKAFRGEWLRKAIQQAESFAHRQTPRRKWALVLSQPGRERRLILMDYDEYLSLISEIQEMP